MAIAAATILQRPHLNPARVARLAELASLVALGTAILSTLVLIAVGPGTSPLIGFGGVGLSARVDAVSVTMMLLVSFVPSFFLAGLILPLDARRTASTLISTLLPATHFVQITRGVFLKGLGWADLGRPALLLAGMGLGAFGASLAFFRKRLR